MKLRIKQRPSEVWIFQIILFIYVALQLLASSTFDYLLPHSFFRVIRYGVLLSTLFLILIYRKYSLKYTLTIFFIAIVLIIMLLFNEVFLAVAIPLLLVLASKVTNFNDILKCIMSATIFATTFIILSCVLNILPDYTYAHMIGDVVKVAHSYGFKYYSSPGYITMTLTAIYLYLHENSSYLRLCVIFLIDYALFLLHTNQTSILVSIFLIVIYIFTKKIKILNFNNKICNFFSVIFPSFLCFGTIGLVNLYKINVLILPQSLSTLTSRLENSLQAINQYGISLFGTTVTMYGGTQKHYGNALSSFYIDSGFLYSLIAYGVVFTVAIILIYTIIYRYTVNSNDAFLFVWLSVILAACVVNNYLLNCCFNPLIFLLPQAIQNMSEKNVEIIS